MSKTNESSYEELTKAIPNKRVGGSSYSASLENLGVKSIQNFNQGQERLEKIAEQTDNTFQKMQMLERQPYLQKKYYEPKLRKKKQNYKVNLSAEELFNISQITQKEYDATRGQKEQEVRMSVKKIRQG